MNDIFSLKTNFQIGHVLQFQNKDFVSKFNKNQIIHDII